MNYAREKLIIALDDLDLAQLFRVIESTKDFASTYKIGLALFSAYGPSLVRDIRSLGVEVFLDLKLHDIPMQVEKAVERCCALAPRFLTIHAQGGAHMMHKAAEAALHSNTKLLAISVLTSIGPKDWQLLGFHGSILEAAQRLASLALSNGVSGLVSSPSEALTIKKRFGSKITLICPGVRPKDSAQDDQARTMTPKEAIMRGADALVIGRPITKARDYARAARAIALEINEALSAVGEGHALFA